MRSAALALGLLLICLPTLHPWYLLLIAPFAAAYASPAWLVLQVSVVFTFPVLIHEYQTGIFQEIHWLKLFEYLPFYGLLSWYGWKYSGARIRRFPPVEALTVVIPCLNEAEDIAGCIASVQQQKGVARLMVVDGGSHDKTVEISRQQGALVFSAEKGRGCQIAQGVKQARGEAVLILHADCRLLPGAVSRVIESLNRHPYAVGGAMAMQFQSVDRRKRWIARLNNGRTRWTGIAFGDQGQFFRLGALSAMGGFPRQMLMEDVELALRSKSAGLTLFLKQGLLASGRRWDARNFHQNVGTVLVLFFTYLFERRWGRSNTGARDYYRRYYQQ